MAKKQGGEISEDGIYRALSENQLLLVPEPNGIFRLVKQENSEEFRRTGKNPLLK